MSCAPRAVALAACVLASLACTNDPYPSADAGARVLYVPYPEAPKTLDPQVAYSVYDHEVLANVYETALEYHYLKRPYELIPGLVEAVPEPRARADVSTSGARDTTGSGTSAESNAREE